MEASGLKLPLGSSCRIMPLGGSPIEAEVVGFNGERVFLMPAARVTGLRFVANAATAPGAVGRVSLRGSNWEARNEGDTALGANQRCRVTRVSGLQLGVVAE